MAVGNSPGEPRDSLPHFGGKDGIAEFRTPRDLTYQKFNLLALCRSRLIPDKANTGEILGHS